MRRRKVQRLSNKGKQKDGGGAVSSPYVKQSDYDKEEKDVYIHVKHGTGVYSWYLIENQQQQQQGEIKVLEVENSSKSEELSNSSDGEELSPIFGSLPVYLYGASFVSLGPHIFAIGGYKDDSQDHVYSIDTRCPQEGWKSRPSLIKPRYLARLIVINRLIYAFGGSFNDMPPWAEVYDINKDQWMSLHMNPPYGEPVLPNFMTSHAVISAGNTPRILLHSGPDKEFYYCNLITREWYVVKTLTFEPHLRQAAQLQGNIYYVHGHVYCYKLTATKPPIQHSGNRKLPPKGARTLEFISQVGGFDNFKLALPPVGKYDLTYLSHLVHIGNGVLCLLWAKKPDYYGKVLHIHCTKFTVSENPDPDTSANCSLVADVKSFNVYEVEGKHLSDCVAVVKYGYTDERMEHESFEEMLVNHLKGFIYKLMC